MKMGTEERRVVAGRMLLCDARRTVDDPDRR